MYVIEISLRHWRWWEPLAVYGPVFVLVLVFSRLTHQRQPPLPLRLSGDGLEVTGPDGTAMSVDWSNLARAEVRGWLTPRLVVRPTDPNRTRPPLKRFQPAGPDRREPYELVIPLHLMTPGRDVLRRELARRRPAARRDDQDR